MKILITGANGMVARAVLQYCKGIGDDAVAYSRAELDITDKGNVNRAISDLSAHALINCAAYTDVDGSESNVDHCYKVNADAVGYMAEACRDSGTTFVTISTDYVFDGSKEGFYTQDDTPNPLSVYGKAKLAGENKAIQANPSSIVVRAGWIFGHSGSNFLSVMHRLLDEGNKITAIEDSYGSPTFASDLAIRLRALAELGEPGIYHAANEGKPASFYDFALRLCEILGLDDSLVEPVKASSLTRPAPRPVNSPLRCLITKSLGLDEMPDWDDALGRFLAKEKPGTD